MKYYKYISQNTLDFISMHDCECSDLHANGGDLVMEMEWMEILGTHPDNPYLRAHQSGEGRIEFHNVSNIQVETGEYQNKTLEILDFNIEKLNTGYQISLNAVTTDKADRKQDFLTMKFFCVDSFVMFNELNGESWFETKQFR